MESRGGMGEATRKGAAPAPGGQPSAGQPDTAGPSPPPGSWAQDARAPVTTTTRRQGRPQQASVVGRDEGDSQTSKAWVRNQQTSAAQLQGRTDEELSLSPAGPRAALS